MIIDLNRDELIAIREELIDMTGYIYLNEKDEKLSKELLEKYKRVYDLTELLIAANLNDKLLMEYVNLLNSIWNNFKGLSVNDLSYIYKIDNVLASAMFKVLSVDIDGIVDEKISNLKEVVHRLFTLIDIIEHVEKL